MTKIQIHFKICHKYVLMISKSCKSWLTNLVLLMKIWCLTCIFKLQRKRDYIIHPWYKNDLKISTNFRNPTLKNICIFEVVKKKINFNNNILTASLRVSIFKNLNSKLIFENILTIPLIIAKNGSFNPKLAVKKSIIKFHLQNLSRNLFMCLSLWNLW